MFWICMVLHTYSRTCYTQIKPVYIHYLKVPFQHFYNTYIIFSNTTYVTARRHFLITVIDNLGCNSTLHNEYSWFPLEHFCTRKTNYLMNWNALSVHQYIFHLFHVSTQENGFVGTRICSKHCRGPANAKYVYFLQYHTCMKLE